MFSRWSDPRHPFIPGSACFAFAMPRFPRTRFPSPHTFRLAILTRCADARFSESRLPPKDFCNFTSTHGHALEHPIFASSEIQLLAVTSKLHALLPVCFTDRRPSPLEEGPRMLRTVTTLLKPAYQRCKHAERRDLRSHRSIATSLAGDASTRPPLAEMIVERQR